MRFTRTALFTLFTVLAVGCLVLPGRNTAPSAQAAAFQTQFNWIVKRHTGVPLDDPRSDQIIQTGMGVLSSEDGTGDVRTDLNIKREGGVLTFDSPAAINSATDFTAANALKARVVVVSEINYCGGPGANIIGCSGVPANTFVVVRMDDIDLEGILWMHEYGHSKGLSHRPGEQAVMDPLIGHDRRRVNPSESTAYRNPEKPVTQGAVPAPFDAPPREITEFVRRIFPEGIDRQAVMRDYTPGEVRALLDMLEDPAEERYWGNIVVALGNTRDVSVFERLKAFVEGGVRTLTPTRYQAKKAALISIGYLANRNNYQPAKDYVMRGAENAGAYWATLRWNNPNISRAANRNVQLGAASAIATGLVGRLDTEQFLTDLESRSERFRTETIGADPAFLESYRSAIKTAIETSRAIRAAGGLAPYFERRR